MHDKSTNALNSGSQDTSPRLLLIRGVPGSGKSTMGAAIADDGSFEHLEADMFFVWNGQYVYEVDKLDMAHRWCQAETKRALEAGKSVVVTNMFLGPDDLMPYFEIAKNVGIKPLIWVADGGYQNTHGIYPEVVEKMREAFVPDIDFLFDEYGMSAPKSKGMSL